MINLQINSRASTKGHSGVFAGGWLPVFWTSDASASISSVQLLPWRPCGSSQQDLKLTFFQRGSTPATEASSPSPSHPLGDETIRWAKPASTPTASLPLRRLSSSQETGLAGGRPTAPSSTSMAGSSLGDEPETGAMALSEGASSAPGS